VYLSYSSDKNSIRLVSLGKGGMKDKTVYVPQYKKAELKFGTMKGCPTVRPGLRRKRRCHENRSWYHNQAI